MSEPELPRKSWLPVEVLESGPGYQVIKGGEQKPSRSYTPTKEELAEIQKRLKDAGSDTTLGPPPEFDTIGLEHLISKPAKE